MQAEEWNSLAPAVRTAYIRSSRSPGCLHDHLSDDKLEVALTNGTIKVSLKLIKTVDYDLKLYNQLVGKWEEENTERQSRNLPAFPREMTPKEEPEKEPEVIEISDDE